MSSCDACICLTRTITHIRLPTYNGVNTEGVIDKAHEYSTPARRTAVYHYDYVNHCHRVLTNSRQPLPLLIKRYPPAQRVSLDHPLTTRIYTWAWSPIPDRNRCGSNTYLGIVCDPWWVIWSQYQVQCWSNRYSDFGIAWHRSSRSSFYLFR